MSLNYGHSKSARSSQAVIPVRALHYQIYYGTLSTTRMAEPYSLSGGYPYCVISCMEHNDDFRFRILSHTFDADDTITTLKVRWFLTAYMLDGTKSTVGIANVNYNHRDVIRVDRTFFFNQEFKLKDVHPNSDKIVGFDIKFRQTDYNY